MGLPPMETGALERTLSYRGAIALWPLQGAFYEESFECDPLATARLLLTWRDALRSAGWDAGLDHSQASTRLQILSALEPVFREGGLADSCAAGRISTLLSEIELGSQPAIDELLVIDPPSPRPGANQNERG